MRVLVCGGRDFTDAAFVAKTLSQLHVLQGPIEVLLHGGAAGADTHAALWALRHDVPRWAFLAEWHKYGKSAGPRRNGRMLKEGEPDVVVAFPGGRGTADMARRARAAGVPVWEPKP